MGQQARRLVRGETVGFVSVATFANAGFTAVAGVLLTRAVDPSARGRIAAALAAGLLASLATTVGFESAIRVLLPRMDAVALRAEYLRVSMLLVTGGLVAGLLAGAYVIAALSVAGAVDAGFVIAFVPLTTAAALARGAAYAEGRANLAASADVMGSAVQAVLVATAAVLGPKVAWFYAAYLVGTLLPTLVYAGPLRRLGWFATTPRGDERMAARRALFSEATKLFVGRLAMAMTYRLDRLLLAALSTSRQLGYYAAAVAVADVALLFPTAVSQVIWRRAAQEEQGDESAERILAPSAAAVAVAGVVATVVAAAASPIVRLLYGNDYLPAVDALRVLAIGGAFVAIWRILATDLLARGHGRLFAIGACSSLAVTVVLCAVLIPSRGALGAALASLVAYGLAAVLAVQWSYKVGVLRQWR